MYRRYRSFLSCSRLFASIDVHKSVRGREGEKEGERQRQNQKATTVNHCIRSDSARLWRAHFYRAAGIFLTTRATNYPPLFFSPPKRASLLALFRVGADKRGDDSLDDEQNWNIANRARVRARIIINAATFIAAAERIIESLSAAATPDRPLFIPIVMRRKRFLIQRHALCCAKKLCDAYKNETFRH